MGIILTQKEYYIFITSGTIVFPPETTDDVLLRVKLPNSRMIVLQVNCTLNLLEIKQIIIERIEKRKLEVNIEECLIKAIYIDKEVIVLDFLTILNTLNKLERLEIVKKEDPMKSVIADHVLGI